ncbi:hypothetical protein FRC02_009477 [Tulasnella sp. 418]|nr:hypothetical protein FRC02_009477 [Tulasnella sp. 418]
MVSAATIDAISDPRAALGKLYGESGRAEGEEFSDLVVKHFAGLFKDEALFSEIPNLSLTQPPESHAKGSLVRFRGMVQDTLPQEVYIGTITSENGIEQPGGWGLADAIEFREDETQFDYTKLKERTPLWVVSVPGESEWVNQTLEGSQDVPEIVPAREDLSPSRSHKFPTNERHIGIQAKVYDSSSSTYKPTDVVTFVGVIAFDSPSSSAFDAPETSERVPTIHVLFSRPHENTIAPFRYPMIARDDSRNDSEVWSEDRVREVRDDLIKWIADEGLCGDRDAAEWVLAVAVSRVHSRSTMILPPSLTITSFPPPTTNPDTSSPEPTLRKLLALVVPLTAHIDLPLNLTSWAKVSTTTPSTQPPGELPANGASGPLYFAPRSVSEDLHAGVLQLPKGTILTVSETRVEEGE